MTPIPLLIGVSACLGAVFATTCMLMGWILDARDEKKRIAKVKEESYQDGFYEGFDAGREWRFRTMVMAKRELRELRETLEKLERRQMAIVSRRCDVPMARRKGLLGKCKKDCKNCLCCIEMNEWGREFHVDTVRGGDPGLLARNLSLYSPRTEKPTGNRRIGPFFGGKRV